MVDGELCSELGVIDVLQMVKSMGFVALLV